MVCKNCGKALGNVQATCPFCGSFISSDQISNYVEMKKEREKDLRPRLVSERYGMDPIKYEIQLSKVGNKLIIILVAVGVLVILFLIVVLILF
ncbi:MAG: hypothetical protein HFI09_04620 [Bacilli bacterium]|nr:hypothetical protein [Bacilli bacterium]